MRVLLDTHALLWWATSDPQLSPTAFAAISDASNEVFVSSVTAAELAIKSALSKLTLPLPIDAFLATSMKSGGFAELPLLIKHAAELAHLPHHHRDPFDRLLISQALSEQL